MPCYDPNVAARTKDGKIVFGNKARDLVGIHDHDPRALLLPCRTCIGCRRAHAQAWALRCWLENQNHRDTVITTLTYSDETLNRRLPCDRGSLRRRDLQLFLKRARRRLAARGLRFFAAGEYGETTHRPHYHAILFGIGMGDRDTIREAWALGHTHTLPVSPEGISYVAGYTLKKYADYSHDDQPTVVDYTTGEILYDHENPFRVMSRGGRGGKGGIGAAARQWTNSWRDHAVYNGAKMGVPRYLHEAWKAQATQLELDELAAEKMARALEHDTSPARLIAGEQIEKAKDNLRAARRKL